MAEGMTSNPTFSTLSRGFKTILTTLVILDEQIAGAQALGAVVVLSGIAMVEWGHRR
jgi:drug/metabolite transporter (DMT)-like permease